MWQKLWTQLRASKKNISVDECHLADTRDGRYQRGAQEIGSILGTGEPLGYRHFQREGDFDVSYLVAWKMDESYQESGQYMVFKIYYEKKNERFDQIGYRLFEYAEVCTYYDGEVPNPGKSLRSKNEAIDCMKQKEGYHECK